MTERSTSATTAVSAAEFGKGKGLSQAAIAYARTRKISPATLERLSAVSETVYFPRRLERKSEGIFFPYVRDGRIVNWKACAFPEKDFIGLKGGKLCLMNIDLLVQAEPGDVWFVEGEWDLASMIEAGIPMERVTTVPNGATERKPDEEGEEKATPSGYGYMIDALKRGLGKHKRFIWCGDGDETGYALRQDMVKLLGEAKFYYVTWPEGVKDANDMLRMDGPQALRELVTEGFVPWPLSGLYSLSELPELAPLKPWDIPHMPSWNGKIRLAPGTMSVVTGHPGHGKTAVFAQIWHDIAERHNLVIATATFETRAKPHYRRILRTLQSGTLERDMSPDQIRKADTWIEDHYRFIHHPQQRPDLRWFLDMAEAAVQRAGAKVVQLDPWNRLEAADRQPGETETEYIGRCLTQLYVFAQDMNVHLQVLAHPAKMEAGRKGQPPMLDDIAGSKHWDNRVDQGFVVHRPKMYESGRRCTEGQIYHKKTRFEELGHPCRLDLNLNLMTGRFEDAS